MKICVTMPAYNEADGICGFLQDLFEVFSEYELKIIVINDKSTDETSLVLSELKGKNPTWDLNIIDCVTNMGHGPATLRGLHLALLDDNDFIVAIDGDGQFIPEQILSALEIAVSKNYDIVECVRTNRREPKFRKVSTLATRILIYVALRSLPKDANTPLRIYKPSALSKILFGIPNNLLTPNLLISGATRILIQNFYEMPVVSLPRRGVSEKGTSWNQKSIAFPSKRFLKFCGAALMQYIFKINPHLRRLRKSHQTNHS